MSHLLVGCFCVQDVIIVCILLLKLQYGADGSQRDSEGKMPYELIPESKFAEQANYSWETTHLPHPPIVPARIELIITMSIEM